MSTVQQVSSSLHIRTIKFDNISIGGNVAKECGQDVQYDAENDGIAGKNDGREESRGYL